MFDEMVGSIRDETMRMLFTVRVQGHDAPQRKQVARPTSENRTDGSIKKQPVRKGKKVGRNDPCPCGSGKKYKKCCGANL